MEKVLFFYYETEEHVEYPDLNSLGTVKWHEIDYIVFVECQLNSDGKYYEIGGDPERIIADSFDSLCDRYYNEYLRVLDNEAHQMNYSEEIEFLVDGLKSENLLTKENVAWVNYFVLYHETRWNNEYEQRKAAREAAAESTRPS